MNFFAIDYFPFYILISIPLFFLVRWILCRKSYSLKKLVWSIILTIILTPVLFFGIVKLTLILLLYEPSYQFSEIRWKTDVTHRYRMVDDMINKNRLINKDTSELKKILGTDFMRRANNVWEYHAGTNNCGFGLCIHSLDVTIEGDKVTKVIHQVYVD